MTAPQDDGLFERVFLPVAAQEHGPGHGAELYERRGVSLEVSEDDEATRVAETRERGLALRLFRGGRTAFAAAGPDGADSLLARCRLLLPRARVRRGARAAVTLAGESHDAGSVADPPPPDERAARSLLVAFRRTLAAAGGGAVVIREASVRVGERSERLATTGGRHACWTGCAASLVASVAARASQGRFSANVIATAARPEELPVARLARHAVDRVLLPLTGRPLAAGRSDVLLDSHVAAHIVARLAPLFFGDEESALLAARTRNGREALASPLISLIDDAQAPGGPIRAPRDGEGTPKQRTIVLDRGLVVGRLTDVAAASQRETTSSGNAIRLTWSDPPRIGVTNLFVDPSPGVSPLDLLANVGRGIYAAVLLERPDVDLAGDRLRLVAAGYVIEKGRATDRVSETVLSGRLSELLHGIAAIGDDLKFVTGAGGSVGSPTLFVPKWRS